MNKQNLHRLMIALLSAMLLSAFFALPVLAAHSTTYKGTDYAKVYDYDYYTTKVHTELKGKSDATVLAYFVKTGMSKGEQAISTFSAKSYRNANQDLRKKYGKKYAKYYKHYIKYGYKQSNRVGTTTGYDNKIKDPVTSYNNTSYDKVYDFEYYMSKYPGLRKKYALDDFGAIKYFVTKGMKLKQQAHKNFNVVWYYNANPDLRWTYCQSWAKLYKYYQRKGYLKGAVKVCTKLKNPLTYYKKKGKKIDLSSIYNFEYFTKHNSAAYKYWKTQNDGRAIRYFVKTGLKYGKTGKRGVTYTNATYKKFVKYFFPKGTSTQLSTAQKYSSSTGKLILVNQNKHLVSIFSGSKGKWTLVRECSCCVGAPATPTPTGVFSIGMKGQFFDPDSGRCWYYSQITGAILFHSQIYVRESKPNRIQDGRMGVSCSHGCVRLKLADAIWIQKHCPSGTTVVSYNRPW